MTWHISWGSEFESLPWSEVPDNFQVFDMRVCCSSFYWNKEEKENKGTGGKKEHLNPAEVLQSEGLALVHKAECKRYNDNPASDCLQHRLGLWTTMSVHHHVLGGDILHVLEEKAHLNRGVTWNWIWEVYFKPDLACPNLPVRCYWKSPALTPIAPPSPSLPAPSLPQTRWEV